MILGRKNVDGLDPGQSHGLLFCVSYRLVCTSESVNSKSHPGSSTGTDKTMSKANVSFWVQKEGNRPDLLCGRAADYPVVKGHFLILVWSTLVLGGR